MTEKHTKYRLRHRASGKERDAPAPSRSGCDPPTSHRPSTARSAPRSAAGPPPTRCSNCSCSCRECARPRGTTHPTARGGSRTSPRRCAAPASPCAPTPCGTLRCRLASGGPRAQSPAAAGGCSRSKRGDKNAHKALCKATAALVMCVCVIYAHQLRHRQLRLGRVRRLHLLLDAPLYRHCLRIGGLPAKQTSRAAAAAARLDTLCSEGDAVQQQLMIENTQASGGGGGQQEVMIDDSPTRYCCCSRAYASQGQQSRRMASALMGLGFCGCWIA
eukprot:COSAG06_NODE_71_length_25945_cov_9.124468_28_plen_274_part_00